MEPNQQLASQRAAHPPSGSCGKSLAIAARFWEPRRIAYNGVLLAVVCYWLVSTWPHFRDAMTLFHLGQMAVLALLANVCYSVAYVIDVAAQLSAVSEVSNRTRWCLWTAGMLFALLIANYWIADEIYPDFH